MTSFESNRNNSGNFFGFSNGRKRRHDSTRKPRSSKALQQFVLEKMEDRWLPAVSWTNTSGVLTFLFGSSGDNLTIASTAVSGSTNNFTFSGTGLTSNSATNVSSVIFQDSVGGSQSITINPGSSAIVTPLLSNSIETLTFAGSNITSNLSVIGSAATLTTSSPSCLTRACLTNTTLELNGSGLLIPNVYSSNSTLTLTAIRSATSVAVTAINGSTVTVASTLFATSSLNQSGGVATVSGGSALGTLIVTDGGAATIETGSTVTTANLSNGTGASTLLVQRGATALTNLNVASGSATLYGSAITVNQTGGNLLIGRQSATGTGGEVSGSLQITNATAVITDTGKVGGTMSVNGSSTVTIGTGANGTPLINADVTVNNGSLTVSDNVVLSLGYSFTQNNGTVNLTGVIFNSGVAQNGGSLSIQGGSFTKGINLAGGVLSANLATISAPSASVAALTISGGSATVRNSTLDATSQSNANAVFVSGSPTSVNFGNATSLGNNTFNIAGTSTRYFISNNDALLTIQAQGNIWSDNGTTYSPSSQPFDVANYLQGAPSGVSGTYGPIYFNGTNLYVLNDQQGAGQNNIQSAIDAANSGETVFVQGGILNYDETIAIGKSLTLAGVDTGAGLPTIAPNAGPGFVFFLRDDQSNATQINTITDFNVNGTNIYDPLNDKIFDVQYSVSASSCLTLSGNIGVTGFSSTNPSMLNLAGGQVVVSTAGTLDLSTQVAASGLDSSFTLSSGSTLNGLFLSGTPSANQTVILSGNLVGPSEARFLGGSVNLTGSIDGPSVMLDGSILNMTGGSVTKDLEIQSGNLVMTSGTLSGSVRISGGNSNISGATISTSTNESNVSNNRTISITGGTVEIRNSSILASNTSTSQRNALVIDGSSAGFTGACVTIASSCITLASTNNLSTAGIRTIGDDNTAAGLSAITLTLEPGVVVTGGQYSIVLNGINTNLTGQTLGNITLVDPASDFIKLENYAFYDQNTLVRTTIDANDVTFNSTISSYSFQPSANLFLTSDLPTLFNIESKIVDFQSVPTVGYVSLYNDLNFVIDGRQIQPVVDAVGVDSTIYIQNGTFAESVTVNSSKTGLILIGAGEYSPGNVTLVTPDTGSNAAFLIQANNVQVLGLTIDGSNGTTPLMHDGSLSGVNYGVTNFNGTSSEPIGNLTVRNNLFTNLINAGVYLNNNGTVLPSSQISDNNFTTIGDYGFNGGVVTDSNAYTSVSNNTMSYVTNGFVMKDFSLGSLASDSVVNNTISAYATGLTLSGFSGTATGPIVGGAGQGNTFTIAAGMNATLGAAITGNTIGIYVQGLEGLGVPTLEDNTVDGFSYGYDITNVNQPLTITGGSVSNYTTSGFHVLKNQIFDPNTISVPGVGSFNPNVTVNALTVNAVAGATGFYVDGNTVVGGASLTLDAGTSYVSGASSTLNATGANASAGSVLTINQATFDVTTASNTSGSLGLVNLNSTLTINSPANTSGFEIGVLTQDSAVTRMTGGNLSAFIGALVGNGHLTITGGSIIGVDLGVKTTNATSILSIDSSTSNTSITGVAGVFAVDSASITINQSTSNLTTIFGEGIAVATSGTGNLTISGGTLTSNSSNNATLSFDSIGTLLISGGQVDSPNLANTIGIAVSNGSASISGVSLNGNAAEGIRFTSATGNLTITGNAISPVISAQNIAVNITTSNASISGGLIQASNGVGISFSSTGTLSLNSNISATTTGLLLTNGFADITGGTVSNSANGILYDGATANGSIHDLTFSNNSNDLNLTNSTGGISLGANNAFSASGLYILNQTTEDFLIDGSTTFSGTILSTLSASDLTQRSTLFAIQDKIVDKLDNASFGLVRLKSSDLFVTTASYYTPNNSADIQRAIDASGFGNTIYVKNGLYSNNLDVNKPLNIQGESSANTSVISSNTITPTVTVSASNVSISCLTLSGVSNTGTGIYVNSTISNLQISGSTLSNLSQALEIGSAGNLTTLGLTSLVMDGNANGISLLAGGSLTSTSLSQIEINQVSGTVFNLSGTVTDLSIMNTNGRFGGNVMTIGGSTTNLTITTSNFSNATGDAIILASGQTLTNATLTDVQFDSAGGSFANLQGPVSGLTMTNVTASYVDGSVLTFGNTASSITLSNVTASNANGSVLTFSSMSLSDLSITNSNFFGTTGDVLTLNGTTTNLTSSSTNFSNATGNAITLAPGQALSNVTLTDVQFDSAGGSFANLQGPVNGLTMTNVTASDAGGTVLTFGNTASSITLSNVTAARAGNSVLTFSTLALTDLSITNSNFFDTTGDVLTLNGTTTNLTVSGTNFSNASGHGITFAAGKTLTNATLTNDQFNNLGGYGADFYGNVTGLTIQNTEFNNLSGTVLTFSGTASNVNLTTVGMTSHANGIVVSGPVTTMKLSGVTVDGSGNGLNVTSTGSISGLTISGSTFNNGTYGILAQADSGSSTNQNRLTGVSITDSTFANNTNVGLSLGMLNDAVLSNLNIHDNGSSVAGSGGILLNLTNGSFTNIILANLTVADNGLGGNASLTGFGISVDATSGSLTNLTLNNVTISGSGASANSMIGLELSNSVALGSTSITGLTVSGANATGIYLNGQTTGQTLNMGNANLATSLTTYIADKSNGTVVTATSATFGGVSAGAGLTVDQAYSIVDKIIDGVDQADYGTVLIQSGSIFVTPSSQTGSSQSPSIQRAINLATTGDTIWIQGNNGSANYTGGVDTSLGGKTLTLNSGNNTSPSLVNTEGDWTLSSNTTIAVRLGGTTAGAYTQYNLYNQTAPMNLSNAVISYSNLTGFTPTVGNQFYVLNQVSNSISSTSSRVSANVAGSMTDLTNGGRYQLAAGQYFMSVYEGGSNHNDFVLISAPSQVSNVVVYGGWTGSFLGDPVNYINSSNTTVELTYGLNASDNIITATNQLQAPNASISIANGTYAQDLSQGAYVNNLTYNIIGLSNVSGSVIPDAQQIGNITVSGVTLTPTDTINYRVDGGVSGQFDQINTDGPIVLGNAVANIVISNNFIAPPSINRWLPLLNNTNATANISGQYYFPNGTPINTGLPLTIPNDPTHKLYTTYKFGTLAPYNDFALIWSLAPGTQSQVVVDASWANVEFGAVKSYNGANYTIGLDGFAQMQSYDPVPSTTLVGGVTAVSANGVITIANGTYNGTFTANKAFSLVGPSGGETAFFPKASGQTQLLSGANVTSASWTGNLRFGDLYVGSGTLFDNAASLIDTDGVLSFESGVTFSNVSLTATRSMTIQSNLLGTSVSLNTSTGCTALSSSGSNVNLTFSDLAIGGTGSGMNLTNTGFATFNNITLSGSITSPSTLNGPAELTLNYPASSASNNLTVGQSTLNFTPFGTSNVSLLTANFGLNTNLGTTAGSAGNNTITLTSNMITGGSITTGGGRDQFNVASAAPVTISAGAGNDTLTMTASGAYVRSFNGDTGTDTIRGGNQNNYFDINTAYGGNISLSRGIAATRTSFSNVDNLIGNALADTFSFTSNSARIASINGGNGNDYLNFNGTSGANTAISYSNPLEFNVNGSSLGTVNYFNFANSTETVPVVDNFTSLENLMGGSGNDVFRMKSVGAIQGSIAGTLDGATGNNTLDYSTYLAGITVNLATRSASGIGSGSTLRISNIRDVYGSAFRDVITGDSRNNILVGNSGNDSILGGVGNDILIGSYGADTLVGGAGWNLDIGGYVNFEQGGTSSAYGIPSQYVDFVLGSMMNEWSGVSDSTSFGSASTLLETTGVSVQIPGNITSYTGIRLFSAVNSSGPNGTVFSDTQVNNINPGTLAQNWIFYTQGLDVITDQSKVKKASQIYKSFP